MNGEGPGDGIDVVYTWVDGGREDYRALLARHGAQPAQLNPERFRDAHDSLRFSLRSLERHVPWVRRVHLFTCRPQVPPWLRRDHPRLNVVHHDQTEANPDILPTFNSNVIESLLHRIPGISPRFIYANDDHFFGAPLAPGDFYDGRGRLKVYGTAIGERIRRRVYEKQWISLGLLEHSPFLIDRREWEAALEGAGRDTAELRRHRFRRDDDLRPERIYRWHLLTNRRARAVAEPFWRFLRYARFVKVVNDRKRVRKALDRLKRDRPRFFCLNDDQGDNPDREVLALVRSFLEELFPEPSSFETAVRSHSPEALTPAAPSSQCPISPSNPGAPSRLQ